MPQTAATPQANHLAGETSPYLLQHAHNPVEWYPWGEEALERARREDRPILLSIGYSACHWCHVMAHESFEDAETARLMNAHFINIKVDREERPDLDRIYQGAHQLLARRPGGWPLTMFLTPDQTPFFGGTYFPPEPRHGLPDFKALLEHIHTVYRDKREALAEQNDAVRQALGSLEQSGTQTGRLNDEPITAAQKQLAASFDPRHGGFGAAPKFPHCGNLALLLRLTNVPKAQQMALESLRAMAGGGLFDQLGGGFYRYAVDERWEIPHFEKMLYDNGPLLELYVQAWRQSGDESLRRVAELTGEWVMREMQGGHGGYFATQDADSGGMEGGFYLWSQEEVRALLAPDEYALAARHYGLDRPANFEGRWHLQGDLQGHSAEQPTEALEAVRLKLFAARARRPSPGRDEKVLVAWNGLMIRAMAVAGRQLGRADFIASAERALAFVREQLFADGHLLAVYKDGRARLDAYLDDYAFMLNALLALLEARWRDADLHWALQLADALLDHFEDEAEGGFFFTAADHERLIQRPKPFADESMPAGNALAALALQRLGQLCGRLDYLDAAERTLRAGWAAMQAYPSAHGSLLCALDEYLNPGAQVILRGEEQALAPWHALLAADYAPARQVYAIPPGAQGLPEPLAAKGPRGEAVAYLCSGQHCQPPLASPEALHQALTAAS